MDYLQMFFDGAEIIGTIAFAASGAMLAIDRELDLFGILFLGATTACGGGIVRDIIMGSFPPNAFSNPVFVEFAVATALFVFLYARLMGKQYWSEHKRIDRILNFLDAVGLGIFSVIGAQMAMQRGFDKNGFLCIFMGMMTGVGGGVIRDLLSRTIPAVLKKHIYAVASIAGAAAYYFLVRLGGNAPISMLIGMLTTLTIRMLSTYYVWNLPKVKRPDDDQRMQSL